MALWKLDGRKNHAIFKYIPGSIRRKMQLVDLRDFIFFFKKKIILTPVLTFFQCINIFRQYLYHEVKSRNLYYETFSSFRLLCCNPWIIKPENVSISYRKLCNHPRYIYQKVILLLCPCKFISKLRKNNWSRPNYNFTLNTACSRYPFSPAIVELNRHRKQLTKSNF